MPHSIPTPSPHTVYVSFLGTGRYESFVYHWDDRPSADTPYGQEAELGLLDPKPDAVFIFGTASSRADHWDTCKTDQGPGLRPRLEALGFTPEFVEIPEDLSARAQWATFQHMLERVAPGDALILDMTHGFRAVPVVFSSALHFLRLAKNITIRHVLYAIERTTPAQIVDYVDFYAIQDWTDGVSRLVEDADASRLAALSAEGSPLDMGGFGSAALTSALDDLTQAVRNVDVHGFEGKARRALTLVKQARDATALSASQVLLDLITQKFAALALAAPLSGRFDADYFTLQLRFIDLLMEHRLYMQAFTAMRELIGSLGLAGYDDPKPLKFSNSEGRSKRSAAEVFVNMLQYPRDEWKFPTQDQQRLHAKLVPFYDRLDTADVIAPLRALVKPLVKLRNGFDHAWTSQPSVPDNVQAEGEDLQERLKGLVPRALAVAQAPDAGGHSAL